MAVLEAAGLGPSRNALYAWHLRTLTRALIRRGQRGDAERAKHALEKYLELLERMGDTRRAEQVRAELESVP